MLHIRLTVGIAVGTDFHRLGRCLPGRELLSYYNPTYSRTSGSAGRETILKIGFRCIATRGQVVVTKSPEHQVTVGPSERNRLHRISKEITAPQKESGKKGKVTRLLTRYRPYAATQQLHIHESLSAAFGRYWRSNNCHGSERDCEGRDGWWTPLFSVHTPKRMAHPHASTLADLEYGAAMPAWTPTTSMDHPFQSEGT